MIRISWPIYSMLLGSAAFLVFALVSALLAESPLYGILGMFFVGALAGALPSSRLGPYFGGIVTALFIWATVGVIFGSAKDQSSAIVMVPLAAIYTCSIGGFAYFAGRLGVWFGITSNSTRTR